MKSIGAVLAFTLVAAIAAVDLTGAWRLHLDPDFGGNDDTIACKFVQDGRKLTIDCGSRARHRRRSERRPGDVRREDRPKQ